MGRYLGKTSAKKCSHEHAPTPDVNRTPVFHLSNNDEILKLQTVHWIQTRSPGIWIDAVFEQGEIKKNHDTKNMGRFIRKLSEKRQNDLLTVAKD